MCKSIATTKDNDWVEEEYNNDDGGNEDDKYLFQEA